MSLNANQNSSPGAKRVNHFLPTQCSKDTMHENYNGSLVPSMITGNKLSAGILASTARPDENDSLTRHVLPRKQTMKETFYYVS